MPDVCTHGLVQRNKFGTDVAEDGREVCRGCGKPTSESLYRRAPGPPTAPAPVLIVTTNEVPGYRIDRVLGDVFGLTVQARDYFSNVGASFRTLVGGEVGGYTKLLIETRNVARQRLSEEASRRGANAVVAMRFDCNAIGDIMNEVVAYGTAVVVSPIEAAVDSTV